MGQGGSWEVGGDDTPNRAGRLAMTPLLPEQPRLSRMYAVRSNVINSYATPLGVTIIGTLKGWLTVSSA